MSSPSLSDAPAPVTVGGLAANVYGLGHLSPTTPASPRSVSILFFLHGRYGHHNQSSVKRWANQFVVAAHQGRAEGGKELVVVTIDQRNHGQRKVEHRANVGWAEKCEGGGDGVNELGNLTHAADMHAIQAGTARDVSFLIDYLPPILFPNDERVVSDWFVAGVSLGGHATWLALAHEPRLSLGIPIIGSPSTLTLLSHRAAHLPPPLGPLPPAPPYFPASLLALLARQDPCSVPLSVWDGRRILVLSGADDALVNYEHGGTGALVGRLRQEGRVGVLEVDVEEGTGHAFSDGMVDRATAFLCRHGLGQEPSAGARGRKEDTASILPSSADTVLAIGSAGECMRSGADITQGASRL